MVKMDGMAQIDRLEAFLRQDPENPALACDLADALLVIGRSDRALAVLVGLPPEIRRRPNVRFREGRCALMEGRLSDAAALLESLENTDVDAPVLRHDLAFVQLALGRTDAAMAALEPALSDPGAPAAVHILHARILHWQGNYIAGLQAIDKVLSMVPNNAEARGVRALLWLDKGDVEAARAAAQQALALDASQTEAAIVSGTLALWEQRPAEAEAAFMKALSRDPHSGRALLGRGQVQLLRGELDAAQATLARAVELMPGHIGSWHALAWCQLLLGDLAGARSSYERALALDRSFGETHGGLAILHALRGETAQAEDEIKRAQRLDPRGRSAVYARSLLLLAQGREDEVRRLVAPLLAATPGASTTDPIAFLERLRAQMQRG